MKCVVGVVIFEDELSASLANPNVPIHVEITTIADVIGDDYKLFAIVADDFYDHMNDLFDNCWRFRTADNLIITPFLIILEIIIFKKDIIMKYIAEIVVFDSPLYDVPSNEQNKPEVIDIIEVEIISDRYNSYAILSDDIVIEMSGNYDDRWFIRRINGEILMPVPESFRDYYTC